MLRCQFDLDIFELIDSLRLNVLSATYIYCRYYGRYFVYQEEWQEVAVRGVNWEKIWIFCAEWIPKILRFLDKFLWYSNRSIWIDNYCLEHILSAVIEEDSRDKKKQPLRLVFSPIYPCLEMKFEKFIKCPQDLSFELNRDEQTKSCSIILCRSSNHKWKKQQQQP